MATSISNSLSRRALCKTGATTALAAAVGAALRPQSGLAQSATPSASPIVLGDWEEFDAALHEAMTTFDMVGAAVSVVTSDAVAYTNTFGVRDAASGAPVTPDTHFLCASTTKSMTALLTAILVDDGVLGWDQPVHEIFSDFRAPTDELTQALRVRDMLDMASGLGEPEAQQAFHQGDPTVSELVDMVADLPVISKTGAEFFYNGTVYANGGYLGALALGSAVDDLMSAYASLMAQRVYRPSGMATARIADDPRPFSDTYATGNALDLVHGSAPQPYASVGAYAPAGGTLATHIDMVNYIQMQLNRGVAADGTRIVSEASLAQCWTSNVDVPIDAVANPDLERSGYGMGWLDFTFRGGHRYLSHAGGIDGFTTFLAVLPDDGLGLVVNTNVSPDARGLSFIEYVAALLLSTRLGLNRGITDYVTDQYRQARQGLEKLAAQVGPVDDVKIRPYLGNYQKGWRLALDPDGTLRLHQSSRSIVLLAMPDSSYVMAGGPGVGTPVTFIRDETGMPIMRIADLETVYWTTGDFA